MVKTILKWLTLILLLGYATCMALWGREEASRQSCPGIDVEIIHSGGSGGTTEEGIREELAKCGKKITGTPVAEVNTREIEGRLSAMSNFESVECHLSTDGRLHVAVTPMIPEIRVFDSTGSYYINKDGKRMASKASFFADVPVVAGNFSESFPAGSLLGLCRFINSDPALRELVGMVEARDADNILLIPRIRGHVVNFGDTSRLREKSRALLAFYRRVMPGKGWDAYDTISVRFRGQVVASRRDKTRPLHTPEYEEDFDPEEATLPEVHAPGAQADGNPSVDLSGNKKKTGNE